MERKLLDMMNQLSISEYNPRMKYCDKFQFAELNIRMIRLRYGSIPIPQIPISRPYRPV